MKILSDTTTKPNIQFLHKYFFFAAQNKLNNYLKKKIENSQCCQISIEFLHDVGTNLCVKAGNFH